MRLSHLSDLHFGHHDSALADTLAAEVASQSPDMVVVSGDFTQLGTEEEFQAARAFLDQLHAPYLAVPGNHDIPERNLIQRFLDPYGLYRRYIHEDLEPFVITDKIAIAGVRTSRRMRMELDWSHGSISRGQLKRLAGNFATAPEELVRIVVAHHPLMQPEGVVQVPMRRVDRADRALAAFGQMNVRLVLSGHFHLSYVRRFENPGTPTEGAPKGPREAAVADIMVAQASSTISTRLRGNTNAYNLIDITDDVITVDVREWSGDGWVTQERKTADAKVA